MEGREKVLETSQEWGLGNALFPVFSTRGAFGEF